MAYTAFLSQPARASDQRRSARRKLRLKVRGTTAAALETPVLIHDMSTGGLLIEAVESLAVGDTLECDVPEAGMVVAEVVWSSGTFHGCQFRESLAPAAMSAALLRSPGLRSAVSADLADSKQANLELRHRIDSLADALKLPPDRSTESVSEHSESPQPDSATDDALAPDDRLPFRWRMRIILGLSLASWALIFRAVGLF